MRGDITWVNKDGVWEHDLVVWPGLSLNVRFEIRQ